MKYAFYTCDVFTDQRFGGNPLAVFPYAAGLDTATMQAIAREFNLSETAFVFPPESDSESLRVRIFTPEVEMPFAGHPTIGTAYVVTSIGAVALTGAETSLVLGEAAGPVPVTVFADNGSPIGAQLTAPRAPEFGQAPAPSVLAAMLNVEEEALLAAPWAPQAVSCGAPFVFVGVRDRHVLARTLVNPMVWGAHLRGAWAPWLYVFCFDAERPDAQVRARMFAPESGVPEDPATGSAAAALGGYLGARADADGTHVWRVEQGVEMGRPSLLDVEADRSNGAVLRVRVGGACVMVSEGTMEV